jgi:ribosomal 50S subunit-recycling heat shock protein
MRLDKYLKVSRVIKRRTVANDISSHGRVTINDKPAKPGTQVKVGDVIEIKFGYGLTRIRVLQVLDNVRKADTATLYEILEDREDTMETGNDQTS